MWVAFIKCCPVQSFYVTDTEEEIDEVIVDFKVGSDEIVKFEFGTLNNKQTAEVVDLILQK